MKCLIIFLPVALLLGSCSPTWKTNEYVKISETEHEFGQLEHAESYIKEQLLKNQTQKPLGLYVSSSLNDGTHGYRHKHGHYHFGKALSYKQTRTGNKGSRSYFQWKFDPKADKAQFYEFAKVSVSYPYKNSTDDEAENVSLEIFTSPKRIDKNLKVNDQGIVINGVDFQKSNSLKGLDSYQYKKTDFDSIARSSYNVKSQIERMEANIPSALSSLSETLNAAQGEIARREEFRKQKDHWASLSPKTKKQIEKQRYETAKEISELYEDKNREVVKDSRNKHTQPVVTLGDAQERINKENEEKREKERLNQKKKKKRIAEYEAAVNKLTNELYIKEKNKVFKGIGGCSVVIKRQDWDGVYDTKRIYNSPYFESDYRVFYNEKDNSSANSEAIKWASNYFYKKKRVETAWGLKKGYYCVIRMSTTIKSKSNSAKKIYGNSYEVQAYGVGFAQTSKEALSKAKKNAASKSPHIRGTDNYMLMTSDDFGHYTPKTRSAIEYEVRKKLKRP